MPKEENFIVKTDKGTKLSGHETVEAAEMAANKANEEAKKLGVKVTYSVAGEATS